MDRATVLAAVLDALDGPGFTFPHVVNDVADLPENQRRVGATFRALAVEAPMLDVAIRTGLVGRRAWIALSGVLHDLGEDCAQVAASIPGSAGRAQPGMGGESGDAIPTVTPGREQPVQPDRPR